MRIENDKPKLSPLQKSIVAVFDNCKVFYSYETVGKKIRTAKGWATALTILRECADITSPDSLTRRLRELRAAGVIESKVLTDHPKQIVVWRISRKPKGTK